MSVDLASQPDGVAHGSKRILVVDDYDDVREMMCFMLHRQSLTVLEARNGREAIEVSSSHHPDLILMDLSMPIMDGYTAIEHLKSSNETKTIPIVALSAHCLDPKVRARVLGMGCIDCMSKPVDIAQLNHMIRQWS